MQTVHRRHCKKLADTYTHFTQVTARTADQEESGIEVSHRSFFRVGCIASVCLLSVGGALQVSVLCCRTPNNKIVYAAQLSAHTSPEVLNCINWRMFTSIRPAPYHELPGLNNDVPIICDRNYN